MSRLEESHEVQVLKAVSMMVRAAVEILEVENGLGWVDGREVEEGKIWCLQGICWGYETSMSLSTYRTRCYPCSHMRQLTGLCSPLFRTWYAAARLIYLPRVNVPTTHPIEVLEVL